MACNLDSCNTNLIVLASFNDVSDGVGWRWQVVISWGVANPQMSAGIISALGNVHDGCASWGYLGSKYSKSSADTVFNIIQPSVFKHMLFQDSVKAVVIWFLAAATLACGIYVPYAEYVTSFLNEAARTGTFLSLFLRPANSHKASWWVCWAFLSALPGGQCAWWSEPLPNQVLIKCRLMPIGFEDFGSVLKLARSATGEKVNGVGLCFVSWRIGFQMCAVGRLWMQRYLCQHRRFPDHWGWESIYFHLLHDVLCPSAEIFTSFAWKTFWKETLLASFVCLLTQKVTVSVLFQGRCICLQCIPLSTGVKQVLAEWERSQVQVPDAMSGFVGTPRQQLVRKHRRPGGSRAVVGGCTDLWSVSMSSAVESFTKCMKLLWQPWTAMSKFTWSLFLRLGEDELSERGKAFFGKPSEENANCNQLS